MNISSRFASDKVLNIKENLATSQTDLLLSTVSLCLEGMEVTIEELFCSSGSPQAKGSLSIALINLLKLFTINQTWYDVCLCTDTD